MIRNASQGIIKISEKNPHYFEYKGKEILLITSAEHYGAVINKKFDYVKYFDTLAEYGLNYTRIFPGALIEPEGYWSPGDPMGPGENTIVPWARSNVPGYKGGGCKFDLSKWDVEYFTRLRDFLAQADKRGIIVEICFFSCQNIVYWEYCPLHKNANIQGVGDCDHITFQTLDNEPLVREQIRYLEKIIEETNSFNNVIYEFCDEPTLMLTAAHKAYHWLSHLIGKAIETENRLNKKHMISQQLEIGVDFSDDDRVSFIVTQYIVMLARQVGGITALNNCYCYNKPIESNEMAFVPVWYDYEHEAISRIEAWEFMVGGGSSFNQLNGYFTTSNPAGDNDINHRILAGLRNLRRFLESFDYIRMYRDNDTVRKVSIAASVNMISEKGMQYAVYMHHSMLNFGCRVPGQHYEPAYGKYEPVVTVKLEKGDYRVTFVEPETLKILKEIMVSSDSQEMMLACPPYKLDIAIKIIRSGQ